MRDGGGARAFSWVLVGLASLGTAGCSDRGGGGTPGGSDAGAPSDASADGGGGDAGDPAQRIDVDVIIIGPAPGESRPGAMLPVAVDLPQGGRVEGVTDAAGHATFGGADFSAGRAAVTAATATHAASRIGIGRADAHVELEIIEYPPSAWGHEDPAYPALTGSVAGMTDATHSLTVSATIVASSHSGVGPRWGMRVRPDVAFSLVALESHAAPVQPPRGAALVLDRWLTLAEPAATADRSVDLDFATPATPMRVSGSIRLPTRVGSPLRADTARPSLNVTTVQSFRLATLGAPTMIAVSTDSSRLSWDVEYVEAVPEADALTTLGLGTPPESAGVVVAGYPSAGELAITLPDVARTIDPFTPRGLHDEVTWEAFGDSVPNYFQVRRSNETVWIVTLPPGATSAVVPALPSAVDQAALLGTSSVSGRPWFCERRAWLPAPICGRSASSRAVELLP